ncbi:MAG: 3-oxoadipyl-CoA thiolase [Bdellovibrionota bacterium]
MNGVYIVDAVRTPIGKYGGSLAQVRADDLASLPLAELLRRNPSIDRAAFDDVLLGCANQAGEDNRNVARMAALLAGLPHVVPGMTLNRLCGSGMSAVLCAADSIASKAGDLYLAGGVEHMTRAPYVMAKPEGAFARSPELFDTTLGWRFVNQKLKAMYGIDSMGETAENVAELYAITREDQDAFALRSQLRAEQAQKSKRFEREIVAVSVPQKGGAVSSFNVDEFPRHGSSFEALAKLTPAFRKNGSVTAGNSSGINDGACAVIVCSEQAVVRFGLTPRAQIRASTVVGVEPRIMGMGPSEAIRRLLAKTGLTIEQIDVIELNEAFASQSLACLRQLGIADDDARVNPNGGAIALGHPLGMSGARLITTALYELEARKARYAICAMCIGVGQGIATLIERVS